MTGYMADDMFTTMLNAFIRIALLAVVPLLIAGCGTILPDRLIYPTEMKSLEDGKKKEKEIAPSSVVVAEEKKKSEPAGSKTAEPADKSREKEPTASESPKPVPDRLKKKKRIDALPSDVGHNALMRLFNAPFEKTWNGVVETMMPLNLSAIDKSSGVLITGWIQDDRLLNETTAALGVFGDVVRFVRYKYIVRVSDIGGGTKVTVVPFAQVSKNRRWHQGKPSVVITEKLMRKLIKKMEER